MKFGSDIRTVVFAITFVLKQFFVHLKAFRNQICRWSDTCPSANNSFKALVAKSIIFFSLFLVVVRSDTTTKSSEDSYAPDASLTRRRKCWA